MVCPSQPRRRLPSLKSQVTHVQDHRPNPRVYDHKFWLAFASNLCTVMAMALLYRYADLVSRLGGGEFELGWIVGIGMIGSIAIRFTLGRTIDRHGARAVWLVSLAALSASCFGHLLLSTCNGPAIYFLRILFASAIAGVFGSSITWMSGRVPTARMAETIGMLGASGFVALALGSYLGDLLAASTAGTAYVQWLFVTAGSLAAVAMGFCWLATRGMLRPVASSDASTARLLWRYSPWVVLLVGVATGVALGLPGTFLRTFTAELGIPRMTAFFGVYSGVALTTRVLARRFPERFGLAPIILLGVVLLSVGVGSFLLVHAAWQLVIPAVILGFAHAIVFPPTIAACTQSFPEQCRGLGTMSILAAYDLGILIGTPLAGALVRYSARFGLPPYPTMFATIAALVGLISLVFAASLLNRRRAASRPTTKQAGRAPRSEIRDPDEKGKILVATTHQNLT